MSIVRFWTLLTLVLIPLGAARAQDFGFSPIASPAPADPVRVSAEISSSTARPGDQLVIAVVFNHAENWHINLNQPVVPKEMGDFVPVPTTITPGEAAGLSFGRIQWPEPYTAKVDFMFTGTPIDFLVYAGRAVAFVPVRVADDAEPGERTIPLLVNFQACDDSICLMPERLPLSVTVTIDDATPAGAPGATFAGFRPAVFADPDAWGAGVLTPAAIEAPKNKFLGLIAVPTTDGVAGIAVLALLAAVGGFVLNLTPCVLPVIPIKIMTISHHAGSDRGRAFMLGLWMAAGVVAFWAGLGVLATLATAFTDPSRLFGFWWFTLGIGLLILAMGVGIMGAFQIKLPQAVYMVNPKADSAQGSFLFGVMTAVLGLPCFGFVAGALLAGVALMPPLAVIVIFASIGIGMALPYLVLAAKPGLVKELPRTGPASELVKQVMGLLMIAAALYFVGSGVLALLSGMGVAAGLPWWAKAVHWWAIALAMLAAGGWLAVQTVRITKKTGPRLWFSVLALLFATAGISAAMNRTEHLRNNFWQVYSSESLVAALDAGNVVVLDFTAEWCLNCKAMEAAVLARDPVKSLLIGAGVVPLMADLTSNTAPGWDTLRSLGQTGIPLLVVFSPESGPDNPVWMSNLFNSKQVVDAIELARSRPKATAARP
jgi:thiol:disulfide interchange protein DsbD